MKLISKERKIFILIIVGLYIFLCMNWADPDMYWIIATGREILQKGFLYINPFFNQGEIGIVVQQWLWCVMVAFMYDFIGNIGCILINATTILMFLFFSVKLCRNVDPLCTLFVVVLGVTFINNLRPQLVTADLLLIQCIIVEKYIDTGRRRFLFLLPILTLIEINIHGSMWVMHFIMLLPYIFALIYEKINGKLGIQYKFKHLKTVKPTDVLFTIPLMLISLLINPYGFKGITYLFDSIGCLDNFGISECQKTTFLCITGVSIVLCSVLLFYLFIKKDVDICSFTMVGGLLFMAMTAYRNGYFLPIAFIFLLKCISPENFSLAKKEQFFWGLLLIAVTTELVIASYSETLNDIFCAKRDDILQPYSAVKYLDDNSVSKTDSRIFTNFNSGGYLEFSGYNTFFDQRPEIFTEKISGFDIASDYLSITNIKYGRSEEAFDVFFTKYDFDYVIVSAGDALQIYLSMCDNGHEVKDIDGNTYFLKTEVAIGTDEYVLYSLEKKAY